MFAYVMFCSMLLWLELLVLKYICVLWEQNDSI